MPISRRYLIGSTSAFLLIGFVALMTIVAMNVWLGERAQSYFEGAIAARNTRVAAVELRNAMQTAESSQRGFIITGKRSISLPIKPPRSKRSGICRHCRPFCHPTPIRMSCWNA